MTYRRATVWWNDAHFDGGAFELDTLERSHRPIAIGKTGWIIIDDELGVTVAAEWLPKDGANDGQNAYEFRMTAFVPRAMIARVEYLEPAS